jgi:hypothetical protein
MNIIGNNVDTTNMNVLVKALLDGDQVLAVSTTRELRESGV